MGNQGAMARETLTTAEKGPKSPASNELRQKLDRPEFGPARRLVVEALGCPLEDSRLSEARKIAYGAFEGVNLIFTEPEMDVSIVYRPQDQQILVLGGYDYTVPIMGIENEDRFQIIKVILEMALAISAAEQRQNMAAAAAAT